MMSEEIWFEETLGIPYTLNSEVVKSIEPFSLEELASTLGITQLEDRKDRLSVEIATTLEKHLQGSIRFHTPRWRPLNERETANLTTDVNTPPASNAKLPITESLGQPPFVLVRLGIEFARPLIPLNWGRQWQFIAAWHRIFLWSNGQAHPRVLALYPERLHEGTPHAIKLEIEPTLKVEPVEFSLGKLSTDIAIGQVASVIVGYHGQDESNPYWELRPGPTPIEGIYNFWLILEIPPAVPINLVPLVDADLQVHMWKVPVGPTERRRELRPKIVLQL
jgi:hypothetical protein